MAHITSSSQWFKSPLTLLNQICDYISLTFYSFLLAKLLVTTGDGSGSTISEIIDLLNPNATCQNWVDYPIDLGWAVGQIVDNFPHICGGYRSGKGFKECYKITPQSAVSLPNLPIGKWYSSAGVFNNTLFTIGGYACDSGCDPLNNTEYISESSIQNGPDVPIEAYDHCVIQINANEILLTGGVKSG